MPAENAIELAARAVIVFGTVRREASLPRKARFIDELATKVDVGPHSLAFRVTRGKLVDGQLPLPGIHCVVLALVLSEIVPALRVKVANWLA